jgi:hypothetical protein
MAVARPDEKETAKPIALLFRPLVAVKDFSESHRKRQQDHEGRWRAIAIAARPRDFCNR